MNNEDLPMLGKWFIRTGGGMHLLYPPQHERNYAIA